MRAQSAPANLGDVDFNFGANGGDGQLLSRLQEEFATFHLNNPKVYESLVRLARKAKAAGKTKCGIGMLFEVARWEFWLTTEKAGGWKLNNNLRSRYARLIMQQEEDLEGFFDIRELRS
jgi:hypothetical protein